MVKKVQKEPAVNLGTLQEDLERKSKALKAAQTAYLRASDRLSAATDEHEKSVIALNQGLLTVKQGATVKNLWLK